MAKCVVSFVDPCQIKHTVTVHASGVYEAAGLALVAFGSQASEWMSQPGAGTTLEVEVHSTPVTHAVTVERVTAWLSSSGSPSELATKHRIRKTLENQKK